MLNLSRIRGARSSTCQQMHEEEIHTSRRSFNQSCGKVCEDMQHVSSNKNEKGRQAANMVLHAETKSQSTMC